jgi:hypothetical protein
LVDLVAGFVFVEIVFPFLVVKIDILLVKQEAPVNAGKQVFHKVTRGRAGSRLVMRTFINSARRSGSSAAWAWMNSSTEAIFADNAPTSGTRPSATAIASRTKPVTAPRGDWPASSSSSTRVGVSTGRASISSAASTTPATAHPASSAVNRDRVSRRGRQQSNRPLAGCTLLKCRGLRQMLVRCWLSVLDHKDLLRVV